MDVCMDCGVELIAVLPAEMGCSYPSGRYNPEVEGLRHADQLQHDMQQAYAIASF